jgi:hypothetical protein
MLERDSFAIAAADSLPYFTYEVANSSSKLNSAQNSLPKFPSQANEKLYIKHQAIPPQRLNTYAWSETIGRGSFYFGVLKSFRPPRRATFAEAFCAATQ